MRNANPTNASKTSKATAKASGGAAKATAAASVKAKTNDLDALALLTSQHDEVEELFTDIQKTDDRDDRADQFAELADKLAAHATIEEKLFYPAVMAKQTADILLESAEEHLSIKRVLADLLELEVDDDTFDAKLAVMKEQVNHHAREEEEGELFPKVRKLLSADELKGLGNEMFAMFERLMLGAPRDNVASETGSAAKLQ